MLAFAACKKEYESIEALDNKNIQQYLSSHSEFQKKDTLGYTFYYSVSKQGTGDDLQYNEVVPLIFTIKSLDGQYVSADTFAVGNRYGAGAGYSYYGGAIDPDLLGYFGREKGYPEVLKYAVREYLKKRNGEIKVIVPSRLAYGINGYGSIPGNASLEYTIKVLNEKKIHEYDDQSISKYLLANGLTGFSTLPVKVGNPDKSNPDSVIAKLYYKIENAGTGSSIKTDSTISVEYTGKFLNGNVFDQAKEGSPATFVLKDVIRGWQNGIPLIKEGGSIRLIIPSLLGYGLSGSRDAYGVATIPTASCLDFMVKVTNVSVTSE